MGLLVRERPPLRLSVNIASPNGPMYRWGADDPNVNNVPNDLTFNTTMPGGFDSATLTLERDPRVNWPDLKELSTVTMYGLGGSVVAYQGRIEEFPSQAGSESNFTPTITGWQAHLQDTNDAAMVYLDPDLTKWVSPTVTRQQSLLSSNWSLGDTELAADPAGEVPALVQTVTDSWASPYQPLCEGWYNAPAGCVIAKIYYSVENFNMGGGWQYIVAVNSLPDGGGSTLATSNLLSGSLVSGTFTPASAFQFAFAQVLFGGGPAGTDGETWNTYWDALQVIGNHGLPLQGTGPYAILASDVIAHAVDTWAPKLAYTTGTNGTIQPSSFGIPQLVFSTTTPLAIIQQAAEYEILDYAVWEQTAGTTGPTLYVNARGVRGRQWVSRVGPAQLQNAGPQVSRIYNGCLVTFTAADGTTQTVGPPGSNTTAQDFSLLDSDSQNPATLAGINRWYLLTLGSSTQAGAITAGAYFLQAQKIANTSGQASLVGHVQDYLTGSWWPAWMVRAGDTISFVDAADTSFRRVVSTSYTDSTRTNAIQLDSPADTMTALLDRLSAVLSPIGLQ